MREALTVILWPSPGRMFEASLFGRPLWQWTLATARSLRPRRVLLVGDSAAPTDAGDVHWSSRKQLPDAVAHVDGDVIVMPAELPCIRSRTLKRLARASRSGPRCLSLTEEECGGGGGALLASSAKELRETLAGLQRQDSIGALVTRLEASPIAPPPKEELIEVLSGADWSRAAQILRRRKSDELLASGVFVDDPTTAHIDPDVRVGRGTRIHGWVVIEGASRIGGDCDIGSFSHIVDSVIGAGTVLLDHCFVRSSRIGKKAQLGPFAHLRPDNIVGAGAKVGNFVELKKTVLGRGSKAPHLTYLGDSRIGRGVNVGAGTITCNYDGKVKHQTIIEDGAFIGSDVQLVAPVRVGRGAYIAAGSCIVEDVPAESLALARSRQVIKRGRMRKARKDRP